MSDNIIVESLDKNEFYELIDFVDLVFSTSYVPHDFMRMLPGLYQQNDYCVNSHRVIRSNGKIVSAIGSFASDVSIANRTIKLEGIGGVATHRREAGKGHMRAIMQSILQHYREQGVMLSWLSGERKRYGRYGYEHAGVTHSFSITHKNIKECTAFARNAVLHYTSVKKDDVTALSYIKALHDKEVIHYQRDPENLYNKLSNWNNVPYIFRDENGKNVGYALYDEKRHFISEVLAESADIFEAMINVWVANNRQVNVVLPPWKPQFIRCMSRICEGVEVTGSGSWLILDWVNVIGALLEAKSSYCILADGRANIGIDGYGVLSIQVSGNVPNCVRAACEPDIVCDSFTATRLMCGHVSPLYTLNVPPHLEPVFTSWFPLPLHNPLPDSV